ncbi:MAG: ATP-binding protein [Methanosphaera sp.]|nr:ATP-binding protein [Methanosphaera sp.]
MLPLNVPTDIDKYFYNRKKDIKLLNFYINSLNENIPFQLLITGYRGVGKTFLLKKLLNEQPDQILTVYLDLSKVYAKKWGIITENDVLKELLNGINSSLTEHESFDKIKDELINQVKQLPLTNYDFTKGNDIFNIPLHEIKDNYSTLSKFTMELPQKIADLSDEIKGFIIVFDEFQLLKKLDNPESFFWLIRSFSQTQDSVSYIFAGSISRTSDIIEMINGQTGAFGGRMIQVNIDPFSEEETKNYMNEMTNGLNFTKEGFDRFYKCTQGIPAYINSFANVLDAIETYDDSLIKEIFVLKIDQIAVIWLRVWGTLNTKEKTIVKTVMDTGKITLTELIKNVPYSKGTVIKYLETLQNKGIIEYIDKNYEITDQMLKSWLKYKKETEGYYPE